MGDEKPSGFTVHDLVVDTIYAVAIGVNVLLIVDQLSDGAVTRKLGEWWRSFTAQCSDWNRDRTEYRKGVGRMLWQAITIVQEDET